MSKRRKYGRQRLYVIADSEGLHKVGISNDPSHRLAQLQTGSPRLLRLVYQTKPAAQAIDIESAAHRILKRYATHGEWFNCSSGQAVDAVNAAQERIGRKRRDGHAFKTLMLILAAIILAWLVFMVLLH
jgi:hypothetical protein